MNTENDTTKLENLSKLISAPFKLQDFRFRALVLSRDASKPWVKAHAYISHAAKINRLNEIFTPLGWNFSVNQTHENTMITCTLNIEYCGKQTTRQGESAAPDLSKLTPEKRADALKTAISEAQNRAMRQLGIGGELSSIDIGFGVMLPQGQSSSYGTPQAKISGKNFSWDPNVSAIPPHLIEDETAIERLTVNDYIVMDKLVSGVTSKTDASKMKEYIMSGKSRCSEFAKKGIIDVVASRIALLSSPSFILSRKVLEQMTNPGNKKVEGV